MLTLKTNSLIVEFYFIRACQLLVVVDGKTLKRSPAEISLTFLFNQDAKETQNCHNHITISVDKSKWATKEHGVQSLDNPCNNKRFHTSHDSCCAQVSWVVAIVLLIIICCNHIYTIVSVKFIIVGRRCWWCLKWTKHKNSQFTKWATIISNCARSRVTQSSRSSSENVTNKSFWCSATIR